VSAERLHVLALALADAHLAGEPTAYLLQCLAEARRAMLAQGGRRTPQLPLPVVYDATRHAAWRGPYGRRPPRPVLDPEGRRFGSLAEAAHAWGVTAPCVSKWIGTRKGWRDAA